MPFRNKDVCSLLHSPSPLAPVDSQITVVAFSYHTTLICVFSGLSPKTESFSWARSRYPFYISPCLTLVSPVGSGTQGMLSVCRTQKWLLFSALFPACFASSSFWKDFIFLLSQTHLKASLTTTEHVGPWPTWFWTSQLQIHVDFFPVQSCKCILFLRVSLTFSFL